jgi:hypothetical protein
VIAPAWATTMSRSDGSVMIAASPVTPARIAASVPCPPSSSPGTNATTTSPSRRSRSPLCWSARTAPRIDATPPFMSHAPRPRTRPSRTAPDHGSSLHVPRSPGGTTSRWPDRTSRRSPRPARPMTSGSTARSVSSPGHAGSPRTVARSGVSSSVASPRPASRTTASSAAASSVPVTLGMRTSSTTSRAIAFASTPSAARRASGRSTAVSL